MMTLPNIAILADSRGFDTYFLNPAYGEAGYGYDRTFAFVLRHALLNEADPVADVCHIPDHFRAATIENNIIRLGLTDPAMVVLLDGIWETLLSKADFLRWAEREISDHEWRDGAKLDLSFDSHRLVELFKSGQLDVSPTRYARRQRRLLSYFSRRRRQVVWLTLPVPPREHLAGRHYAGDYLTFPGWGDCLRALNDELAPLVTRHGGRVLDLNALMNANGGAGACLIDQWHFTPAFHQTIADELRALITKAMAERTVPDDHISHQFMLPRVPGDVPVAVVGQPNAVNDWIAHHPQAAVAERCGRDEAPDSDAKLVLLLDDDEDRRDAKALELLNALPMDRIVVYADELEPLVNPPGGDRTQYGRLG
ncbi:MAG: hypothetical protein OEQ29_09625 [Alphaproteobacteria bacterium]|nr:hypothetical protein [Alphaproteobacteria bacterium]